LTNTEPNGAMNRCCVITRRHQVTNVRAVTSRVPMTRSCSNNCYGK